VSCLAALGRQTGSGRSLVILVGGGGRDTQGETVRLCLCALLFGLPFIRLVCGPGEPFLLDGNTS
jgi:hypothetical protein